MADLANLIICLTPLQALMAQRLMAQRAEPFDLLMLCYEDADNAKFRHYFQVASVFILRQPRCNFAKILSGSLLFGVIPRRTL